MDISASRSTTGFNIPSPLPPMSTTNFGTPTATPSVTAGPFDALFARNQHNATAAQNASNSHLPAIDRLPLQAISPAILPFAPLILFFFSVGYSFLDLLLRYAILPRVYGKIFTTQEKGQQLSFVMHHCGLIMFLPIFVLLACPLIDIFSGEITFADLYGSTGVIAGDGIMVLALAYCGVYLAQMFIGRKYMSFSTTLHHISLLAVGLGTIGMTGDVEKYQSATVSFYIISMWCIFDIGTDIFIHAILIRYRVAVQHKASPRELSRLMHVAALCRLATCMANLGATVYLFYAAWHKLSTAWAVGVAASGWVWLYAQLESAHVMYMISRRVWHERREAVAAARAARDGDKQLVEEEVEGASPRSGMLFNDPAYASLSVGTTLLAYSHASGHVVSRSHLVIVSVGLAVGLAMFLLRYFSHDIASATLQQAAERVLARGEGLENEHVSIFVRR